MEKTKIVTISGESGAGKSTFSKYLAQKLSAKVVSVDEIISKLYQNEKFCKKIFSSFGNQVLNNGKIEKQKVGMLVFDNAKNQSLLTAISTPFIEKEIKEQMKGEKCAIIDYKFAPMLSFFKKSNFNILLVANSDEKRLDLVLKRDNVSKEYLLARDKNRVDYGKYRFDEIIFHDYDDLKQKAGEIARKI